MDSSISSNSLVSSWMSLMASCSSRELAHIRANGVFAAFLNATAFFLPSAC